MRVHLDYGSTGLDVELPDEGVCVIEPRFRAPLPDAHAALTAALRSPLGSAPLRSCVRAGQRVAISVCDVTRPQPRREVLKAILDELDHLPGENITILVATGTHRANTPAELESMVGVDILRRCRVLNHDCRDGSSLTYVGRTSTGVPVHLNRAWLASDVRITTGVVEPHFFAGFSGGPKMVAPGLAGLDTVLALHNADRIGHPGATWGVTEGNPVHDAVREIARLTGVTFALDVTVNRDKRITGIFAGDLFEAHREACAAAARDAMCSVQGPFDVVLTTNSGYPLDQNLYQAVKGLSAAARVVRQGGTIVCAAECRDGVPDKGAYGQLLASAATPKQLLARILSPGYSQPDQWQAQIQAQIQMKAAVLMKAGGLTADRLRAAHLEPVDDVGEAVARGLRRAGPSSTLCVLPQGPRTIPYLAGP
ncbi:MAG: nickel-dependent lactate racemase [Acidobacteria bacterium]|nr:nickel-dependent lactate racemase [Acidobacteriota bacterium]